MAKVIFLFSNLKIVDSSLEDLETTEDFLKGKNVDELGYDEEELARAYANTSVNFKIG